MTERLPKYNDLFPNKPPEPPFPLDRCPPDIFIRILQAVVDDEAAQIDPRSLSNEVNPRVPANLALVCQSWKNTVYNTPSLWAFVSLSLGQPMDVVKARFDRIISRAKAAPMDLYLFNVHIHRQGDRRRDPIETCASTKESIRYFLDNIQSLRKLQVDGNRDDIRQLIVESNHPHIATTRELVHFVHGDTSGIVRSFNWTSYIGSMQNLANLWMNEAGCIEFDICKSRPLLPRLKKLSLQSNWNTHISQEAFFALLTQAPNIEKLKTTFHGFKYAESGYTFKSFSLPRLKSITTHNMAPYLHGFSEGFITTPALKEFSYYEYNNQFNKCIADFFRLNPSIEDVTFSTTDVSRYHEPLSALRYLRTFRVLGGGKGEFLESLITKTTTDTSEAIPVLAHSLDKLEVLIMRNPLQLKWFEALVESRCIPVDVAGNTKDGCTAVDLTLVTVSLELVITEIEDSRYWKTAEITQKGSSLTFQWKYT